MQYLITIFRFLGQRIAWFAELQNTTYDHLTGELDVSDPDLTSRAKWRERRAYQSAYVSSTRNNT